MINFIATAMTKKNMEGCRIIATEFFKCFKIEF
jgi:hypothetical protein